MLQNSIFFISRTSKMKSFKKNETCAFQPKPAQWRDGLPPQQKNWKQNTYSIHKYAAVRFIYTRTLQEICLNRDLLNPPLPKP